MNNSLEEFPGSIESVPGLKARVLEDIANLVENVENTSLVYGTISGIIKSVPTEFFEKKFDTTKDNYIEVLSLLCDEIESTGFPIENLKRIAFVANPSERDKDFQERIVLKGGTQVL